MDKINKNKKSGSVSLIKIEKTSSQIAEEKKLYEEDGLIRPPYDPCLFTTLYESNSTFAATVNQIARDVSGNGWNLNLKEGSSENNAELDKIKEFLKTCNSFDPFRTVMKELLIDWGAVGYFGLEVVRNKSGEVVELYRIPAYTLRVHTSKKKFCQIRNNKQVWFKAFGEEDDISSLTGSPITSDSETKKANEMIFYRNTYLKSDYCGVPNVISALGELLGLIEARDYNMAFFRNNGLPSSIITLTGDWEEGTEKSIEEFLDSNLKGAENAFKTLVMRQPEGCGIKIDPIGSETKDGSFQNYQKDNKENILMAYSMPPQRIGVYVSGSLNGSSTKEANDIYKSSTVEPLQTDLEDIINKILQIGLKINNYEFKFKDIDFSDKTKETERATRLFKGGLITRNEGRLIVGFESIGDEGDVFSEESETGFAFNDIMKEDIEEFKNDNSGEIHN